MGIACPGDCAEAYPAGATVTVRATPGNGYRLDTWDGSCAGDSATCTVTMDRDRSVTARFRRKDSQ